jgi:hypothetical protein
MVDLVQRKLDEASYPGMTRFPSGVCTDETSWGFNAPILYVPGITPRTELVKRNLLADIRWLVGKDEDAFMTPWVNGSYRFKIGIVVDQTDSPLASKIVVMLVKKLAGTLDKFSIDFVEIPDGIQAPWLAGRIKSERVCDVCKSKENIKRCACSGSYYCSEEHQKKDWPNHRERCKLIRKSLRALEPVAKK